MNIKKSSLKVNIIYNIFYQILTLIVPLITAPYISRIIGKEGMGIYGYTFSIAHYFMLLIMLGILNYGVREISLVKKDKNNLTKTFWNIYIIQAVMGCVSIAIYFTYIVLWEHNYTIESLSWFFYLVSGALDISWFFFGIELFRMTTLVCSINRILSTVCIFLFVKDINDVVLYIVIIGCGSLLNHIIYWIALKRYISFSLPVKSEIIKHIKPLIILFLPVIAINIYRYISKIMLGVMYTMEDVGIYEAAEKLINLPLCIIAAIGTVMLPKITSLSGENNKDSIVHYNHISMVFVMLVSVGMTFGLLGISDVFVPLFYGDEFIDATVVLRTLMPTLIIVSWANVIRTQYLLPNRKDTIYCFSVILGAMINLLVNLVLIPKMGIIGAAVGSVSAEFVVCFFQTWNSRKDMKVCNYVVETIPFFICGVLMYFCILNVNHTNAIITVIERIVIGGIVYSILCFFVLKKIFKFSFSRI